jgi:hypothetical protein
MNNKKIETSKPTTEKKSAKALSAEELNKLLDGLTVVVGAGNFEAQAC